MNMMNNTWTMLINYELIKKDLHTHTHTPWPVRKGNVRGRCGWSSLRRRAHKSRSDHQSPRYASQNPQRTAAPSWRDQRRWCEDALNVYRWRTAVTAKCNSHRKWLDQLLKVYRSFPGLVHDLLKFSHVTLLLWGTLLWGKLIVDNHFILMFVVLEYMDILCMFMHKTKLLTATRPWSCETGRPGESSYTRPPLSRWTAAGSGV